MVKEEIENQNNNLFILWKSKNFVPALDFCYSITDEYSTKPVLRLKTMSDG